MPVRNADYWPFVIGAMLKGANAKVTWTVNVSIEQFSNQKNIYAVPIKAKT